MTARQTTETWVSSEEARKLCHCGQANVTLLARTQGWKKRPSESRGRNGKRCDYLLSSMPAAAQARFFDGRRKNAAIVTAAPSTLPLFDSASAPELAAQRIAIPGHLEEQAASRLDAIRLLLDSRKQRKEGRRLEIRLATGKIIRTTVDLAKYIGEQQTPPVKGGTILDWLHRFDTGGITALADRPRKDKGKSRFFEEHPVAAALLQTKFLDPREGLSREMAWEAVCREWKRIGEKGLPPCYDTARTFLNALPEPLKVLSRGGKETHERLCSPFIQRSKVPVMDWWVSDHREFDVLVRNTLFAEMKQDQAYRLWLTALYDWGSRKIVGFCLAPNPSKRTINSSIRMGVLSHGFPANFYWDNGKDYGSARADLELITLSEEAQTLLERNRIGVTSAIPKRPRSKPIESWFARWSKRFDVVWRPAYLGNKPGNRPESGSESQKQHEKYLAGKRSGSPLPSDAEFIVATVQWIEEYNETRLESLDHRTPNEVMEEAHPELNRPKINPRLLDILFSERTKRIVQKGGCVQLDGMRYEPTDESLFALDTRQGREVAILRDPYNLGEAIAADAETLQFVGELRMQQFVAQCPNGQITRDQIKAAMRRERSLRKGYAEYLAALSALAASQGWKTEREALLERAIARTGTDGAAPGVAPGTSRGQAQLPAPRRSAEFDPLGVTFVAPDADSIFDEIRAEDGSIIYKKASPADSSEPSSLTVDEDVRKYLAKETEP